LSVHGAMLMRDGSTCTLLWTPASSSNRACFVEY
jgi:hypothetical protein